MNEKLAFRILKKAEKKLICKAGFGFWVSDGAFIFRTTNTDELMAMGLLDYNRGPNLANTSVAMAEYMNRVQELVPVKNTRILLVSGKMLARMLFCGEEEIHANNKYYEVFEGLELYGEAKPNAPVYAFDKAVAVGAYLPLRRAATLMEIVDMARKKAGNYEK